MNRQSNIIIAEPSVLVFNGLASVIANSGRNLALVRAESAEEIQRLVTLRTAETVIINPSLVAGNPRSLYGIRSVSETTRLIALVYAFFDESLLSLFDDRITINDPPERIMASITGTNSVNGTADTDPVHAALSERETEVLRLLASGMSTKEIAEELHISTNTVITHRKNLSAKTGIRSVSGLAIYAVVKKLISPGGISI